jgi:hypothetical protein
MNLLISNYYPPSYYYISKRSHTELFIILMKELLKLQLQKFINWNLLILNNDYLV